MTATSSSGYQCQMLDTDVLLDTFRSILPLINHRDERDPVSDDQQCHRRPYPLTRVKSEEATIPLPPAADSPRITIAKASSPRCVSEVSFDNLCFSRSCQLPKAEGSEQVEKSEENGSFDSQEIVGDVLDPKEEKKKHRLYILLTITLMFPLVVVMCFFLFWHRSDRNEPVEFPANPFIQQQQDSNLDPTLPPVEFNSTPTPSPTMLPSLPPTFDFEGPIRDFLFQDNNGVQIAYSNPAVQRAVIWLVDEATSSQKFISPFNEKFLQRFGILVLYYSLFQNQTVDLGEVALPNVGMRIQDECFWRGMACDGNRILIKIKLPNRRLSGTLPAEWGFFSNLKSIDLSYNELQGSIPEGLYDILGLEEVFLYKNHLTGTLSSKIGDLWTLRRLQLGHNKISGSIPPELASRGNQIRQIRYLDVHRNQMTGSIPSNMRLRQMFYMDLGYNNFSGTLPPDLGTDYVRLRHLHLDHNGFAGTFPESYLVAGDGRIHTILVNDNYLTGIFPGNHQESHRIYQLTIQNNNFTSIDLNACRLSYFGYLIEFKTNCNICQCRGYYMCRLCV